MSTADDDRADAASAELVDVLDDDGNVIGTATRAEIRAGNLWHRSVFVAVIDGAGERLLVHQRAAWKDVWPSRWDVAFGGVLDPGEDFAAAAGRELAEEAGLEGVPLAWLGEGTYADDEVRARSEVFLARSDGPFTFPDGEVAAHDWVALADLDGWLADRSLCPDSVALVVPRLPGRA